MSNFALHATLINSALTHTSQPFEHLQCGCGGLDQAVNLRPQTGQHCGFVCGAYRDLHAAILNSELWTILTEEHVLPTCHNLRHPADFSPPRVGPGSRRCSTRPRSSMLYCTVRSRSEEIPFHNRDRVAENKSAARRSISPVSVQSSQSKAAWVVNPITSAQFAPPIVCWARTPFPLGSA